MKLTHVETAEPVTEVVSKESRDASSSESICANILSRIIFVKYAISGISKQLTLRYNPFLTLYVANYLLMKSKR